MKDIFYTYLWLREDGTPYYAGKGKDNRGFVKENHRCSPPAQNELVIVQEWPSEEDAFEAEKFLIAYYGRRDLKTGCLRNLTDGGEGFSGLRFSEEHRRKLSVARKQRITSQATRVKMSASMKAKPHTSRGMMGKKHSASTKAAMSAAARGRMTSISARMNMSLAQIKRFHSEEATCPPQ